LTSELSRRAIMAGAAGAGALLAAPAKSATTSKNAVEGAPQVKITAIESFDIQLPRSSGNKVFLPTYRGMTAGRNNVVKISTDAGVAGYSFLGATLHEVSIAAAFLVGKNLFAVEAPELAFGRGSHVGRYWPDSRPAAVPFAGWRKP